MPLEMIKSSKMSVDIESRSEVDLKKVGVHAYALHPTTEIQCIAFKTGEKAYVITPKDNRDFLTLEDFQDRPMAEFFLKKFYDPETELYAWNESFERVLFDIVGCRKLGFRKVHYTRWECSMVRALFYNLPGSLKSAANALPIKEKKDMAGNTNMLSLCKPRPLKHRKGDRPEKFITRQCDDPKYGPAWRLKYKQLYEYCRQDVIVEDAISNFLQPIPAHEHNLFNFDKRMNSTGLVIDIEAVKAAQKAEKLYKAEIYKKFADLTAHEVIDEKKSTEEYAVMKTVRIKPSQKVALKKYWNDTFDLNIKGTGKEIMKPLYRQKGHPELLQKQLDIFKEASKTALSKLKAFIDRSVPTGDLIHRVFNSIQFYGASATGRFAGRGIQPQNMPSRNIYKHIMQLFKDLKSMTPEEFVEEYRKDGVIMVLSSCLRGFIIPPPNGKMWQYDYSAIEGRVSAWLVGVKIDLACFNSGLCVYREFGKLVYGLSHDEAHALPKGGKRRAILKECVLSLCYGTGHDSLGKKIYENSDGEIDIRCKCRKPRGGKLIHTCEAHRIVKLYRGSRPGMKKLWDKMERAAYNALSSPGKMFKVEKLFKFKKVGMFLYMGLPNGRTIKYPGAAFDMVDKWDNGELIPDIYYFGSVQKKKTLKEIAQGKSFDMKWRKKHMYGAKFFQNACQAIARDVMCEAMERIDNLKTDQGDKKHKIALTVHDEILAYFRSENVKTFFDERGNERIKEIEDLMVIRPLWAPDLPLAVEGRVVSRFCK